MSTLPPASPASQLNRVCAWLLLGLSVLTALWSIGQLGAALAEAAVKAADGCDGVLLASHGLMTSGLLGWVVAHASALSALQLLSCLPCIAIALGMLRGNNWARLGFIALLLLTAVLNLATLPLLDRLLMDLLTPMLAQIADSGDASELITELRDARIMLWVSSGLPLLALSAIHVWLARRFDRADIRALFSR